MNKFFVSYWLAGIDKMRTVFARDASEARSMVAKDVEMILGSKVRNETGFTVRPSGTTAHFVKQQRRA